MFAQSFTSMFLCVLTVCAIAVMLPAGWAMADDQATASTVGIGTLDVAANETSTVGTSAATTLAPWKVKAEALKAKNAQRREEAMARLAEAKALLKLSPKERQQKRKEMADKRKAELEAKLAVQKAQRQLTKAAKTSQQPSVNTSTASAGGVTKGDEQQ